MSRAVFLLIMLIASIGAEERGITAVSEDAKEGKNLYAPLVPPVDLEKERQIQERDQNTTRQSSQI